MYGVTRRYFGASALIDALAQRTEDVEEVIRGVPGFVAYFALRSGGILTTVSIFENQDGTKESTRRAAAWIKDNLPGIAVNMSPPEVNEGEVFIEFSR